MIRINERDRFLTKIVEGLNELPVVRSISNPRVLYVYGISQDRDRDVVIPQDFPYQRELLRKLSQKGISTITGCYWGMAQHYNNKVLGLGYGIRKNNAETAKRVIIMTYLTLNDKISEFTSIHDNGSISSSPRGLSLDESPVRTSR